MNWLTNWLEAERGRFILLLPIAMGSAILIYFSLNTEPPLWLSLVLPGLSLISLVIVWRLPPARFAAALLVAGSFGFARAEWRTASMPPLMNVPYGAIPLTGRVAGIDLLPEGRRITLANAQMQDEAAFRRTIRVRLRNDDSTPIMAGDEVSLRAMLFRQDRPAYPGGWDFGRDAFFQVLGASGFALSDVTILHQAPQTNFAALVQNLRNKIAARIMAVLPVSTGAVAVTLLTGFQQAMPGGERQAFVTAGLAHILAVAGLHVGIVMGLFFGAARFALSRFERVALHINGKAAAALIALAAGAAYALLTGAHLPILRSLAMASLVTLGVLAGRRAISLRGLGLAAMVLMLATPEVVIGVSFQMSFSAVLALIAGYAALKDNVSQPRAERTPVRRLASNIFALAYTSLLAGGASMPFAAFQFQQIQPYWILANLIAVPLTAFWVMPLGLFALALMPFGLAAFALLPMGWGISIIVWLTQEISAWPGAMLRIQPVSGIAILCFAFGLVWLCLWRSLPRLAGIAFMLAGFIIYASSRPPDALVSPDAKLIAIRMATEVLLHRQPKAASYTVAQWQSVWGDLPLQNFDPTVPQQNVTCQDTGCLFATENGPIMLALVPPYTGCKAAVLILAAEPLRGACDAPGHLVIDRFSVWRDGAMAVWISPHGFYLRTDRQVQGSRPWVPDWPEYWIKH
jgi:competence protein ComEC